MSQTFHLTVHKHKIINKKHHHPIYINCLLGPKCPEQLCNTRSKLLHNPIGCRTYQIDQIHLTTLVSHHDSIKIQQLNTHNQWHTSQAAGYRKTTQKQHYNSYTRQSQPHLLSQHCHITFHNRYIMEYNLQLVLNSHHTADQNAIN
ncbi:unnamed protein product [Trifolium pratense]|uniref:Uncharacterized protein n=1 Tax=Trifolium pratense TaxID=57577 RepID=A0ACB0LX30_TRIPR|nr:unnamed protein product [Trifolium pratense]